MTTFVENPAAIRRVLLPADVLSWNTILINALKLILLRRYFLLFI